MADTFVLVPRRKWRDPWYRRLSRAERDAWDYLTQYPGETFTGLFEANLADMAYEAMLTIKEITAAIDRFMADGKLMREGDVYLPVKWFEVQMRGQLLHPSDNRYKPIQAELTAFEPKAPTLVAEWNRRNLVAPHKGLAENRKAPPKQYQDEEQEQKQHQEQDQKEKEKIREGLTPPKREPKPETGTTALGKLKAETKAEGERWARRLGALAAQGILPPRGLDTDALRRWISQAEKQAEGAAP